MRLKRDTLGRVIGVGRLNSTALSSVIARNGALLIVPPLVISTGLWARLPAAFGNDAFDQGIPAWLLISENALRAAVLLLPALLLFGATGRLQRLGWILYGLGLISYLASYVVLITLPASAWSSSALGFTAPAWTTGWWLLGIGLVCADTWLPLSWSRLIYLIPAAGFVLTHSAHAWLAYLLVRPS